MKVSLDGGITWQDANEGVRVIYDDMMIGELSESGELHLNCTEEGLITDVVWFGASGATSSEMAQEVVDRHLDDIWR